MHLSKWAISSMYTTSCINRGPLGPTVKEFNLSAIGHPDSVVNVSVLPCNVILNKKFNGHQNKLIHKKKNIHKQYLIISGTNKAYSTHPELQKVVKTPICDASFSIDYVTQKHFETSKLLQ